MIKTAVKLALVALVANGLYRVGSEYMTFVRFREGVRAAAVYRAMGAEDLRARIMVLVSQYDIPLGADDVIIDWQGDQVSVSASYRKSIDLLPRYPVEWPFDASMQVRTSHDPLPGAPPLR